MKRLCSILLICTLVIGCMCILSGCSEVMYLRLQEEELYAQKLEEFFSVLDSRDATAMRAMFSPTVQQEDIQMAW